MAAAEATSISWFGLLMFSSTEDGFNKVSWYFEHLTNQIQLFIRQMALKPRLKLTMKTNKKIISTSVFPERLNLLHSRPVDSANMSSALVRQLRDREIGKGKNNQHNKLRIIHLDLTGIKISLANLQQPQSQLLSLKFFKIKENKELVNETTSVLKLLSGLANLVYIDFEGTAYLKPSEVLYVISSCPFLKTFYFSPAWRRNFREWTDIYENAGVEWGEEFHDLYRRVKYGFVSQRFLDMSYSAPEWALSDSASESD